MDNTSKPIEKIEIDLPPIVREPEHRFYSKGDFDLYVMMCDQIEAGVNCDFYRKKVNQGFVMMPNGNRTPYFRK